MEYVRRLLPRCRLLRSSSWGAWLLEVVVELFCWVLVQSVAGEEERGVVEREVKRWGCLYGLWIAHRWRVGSGEGGENVC
jgi:hypothetical protein